MKKVTGQYQTEYVLDTKSKQGVSDGDVYRISGGNGLCAKILRNPSKTMQLDLENAMQGGMAMGISETPMDIAYSRGKFVGYIYQGMEETVPVFEPETEVVPSEKTSVDLSILDNMGFKVLLTVVVGLLLALLNTRVLYWQYISFVSVNFSSGTLSGCMMLGVSGITSTVGGIAAMIALGMAMKDSNGLVFIPLEAVSFFVGILVVDVILTIVVAVVLGAVSLIIAIMPTIILIAVIIWIFKRFF